MATEFNIDSRGFGGLIGVIADALGREVAMAAPKATARAAASEPVALRRGRWWVPEGVDPAIARPRNILERLDRWFWKQQMRETEAYLAQAKDIFELEARMRRLERGAAPL